MDVNPKNIHIRILRNPEREISISAWKTWLTPRRLFYLIVIILCFISLILFIVSASINSSAIHVIKESTPIPATFVQPAPYILGPALLSQGAILVSQDHRNSMLFTDDLYLMDLSQQKILWSANASSAGPLMNFNTEGEPQYGTLFLSEKGLLVIKDGFGSIRWSNNISGPTDSYVLIVTPYPLSSLQVQLESLASVGQFSSFLWRVDSTTPTNPPILTSINSPSTYAPLAWILQSPNQEFFGQFEPSGKFSIYNYQDNKNPIWQSTFNSAVSLNGAGTVAYTLNLRLWGELTIVNNCQLTVWSSQSASFNSVEVQYSLILANDGTLQILSSGSSGPFWTSSTIYSFSSLPLAWSTPTVPFTSWGIQSLDQSVHIVFNSENSSDSTNGSLLLYSMDSSVYSSSLGAISSFSSTPVNLSNTDNLGKYLTLESNGSLTIRDSSQKIVFSIPSSIPLSTCYNISTGLPYVMVASSQPVRQLQAFSQLTALPQWNLPLSIPGNLPSSISATSQPLGSFVVSNVAYLLQSSETNPQYILRLDNNAGLLSVVQVNTGQIVKGQNFRFVNNDTVIVYFQPSGLFSVIGKEAYAISKWNSESAQFNSNLPALPVMSIDPSSGNWVISVGQDTIWNAANFIQGQTSIASISSLVNVSANNTTDFSQTVNLNSLSLISQNGQYSASFSSSSSGNGASGSLLLKNVNTQAILWSSNSQGADTLLLDETGNLIIRQQGQIRFQLNSEIPDSSLSSQLPVTLSVNNSGSLLLTGQDGTQIWAINGTTNFNNQLEGPSTWVNSTFLGILTSTNNLYELGYANGVFSVVSLSDSKTIWTSAIPDSSFSSPYQGVFRSFGDLLVLDNHSQVVWTTGTANFYDPAPPYILSIGTDGTVSIFSSQPLLYNLSSSIVWNTNQSHAILSSLTPQWLNPQQWSLSNPALENTVTISPSSMLCNPSPLILQSYIGPTSYYQVSSGGTNTPGFYFQNSVSTLNPPAPTTFLGYFSNPASSPVCSLISQQQAAQSQIPVFSLTLTDTVTNNLDFTIPGSTMGPPILLVNDYVGNLIGSYPSGLQLPTSVCWSSLLTLFRGFQLLPLSDSLSFLSFTMRTKQLLFQMGTPQNPSTSFPLQSSPDLSSVPSNNNSDFRMLLLPTGFLVIGRQTPAGSFDGLWSTNRGISVNLLSSSPFSFRLYLSGTPEFLIDLDSNSPSCSSTENTYNVFQSSDFTNTKKGSSGIVASSDTQTNSVNYTFVPGTIYTLLNSVPFKVQSTGADYSTITGLFGSVWNVSFCDGTATNKYLPELYVALRATNSNGFSDIYWQLSLYYNVYCYALGKIFITPVFDSSSTSTVRARVDLVSNSFVVEILLPSGTPFRIFQAPSNTSFLTNDFPSVLLAGYKDLVLYSGSRVLWDTFAPLPALVTPLSRDSINVNFSELRNQVLYPSPNGGGSAVLIWSFSGEMWIYNGQPSTDTTHFWSNLTSRGYYMNFTSFQQAPNTLFPLPSYRQILTVSGNLVIRDQADFVLWTSGTASYEILKNSVPDPSQAQMILDGTIPQWSLLSQLKAYYVQPNPISYSWSLCSPASIGVDQSTGPFAMTCNVRSQAYFVFDATQNTFFLFRASTLQLQPNGSLQVSQKCQINYVALSTTSSTYGTPLSTMNLVFSDASFWTSNEDGFYENESSTYVPPLLGKILAAGDLQGATLWLTREGYLQVWAGIFPDSPNGDMSKLLFNLNSLPSCNQLISPGAKEFALTTAGLFFQTQNGNQTFYSFEPGWNGNLVCYTESTTLTGNTKIWQIPPCLSSTIDCSSSSCPSSFPSDYGISSPLAPEDAVDNKNRSYHLKRITTADKAEIFLKSADGHYGATLQLFGSNIYLGVVDLRLVNFISGTALDPNQFGGWYYTLPLPSGADPTSIGLYFTDRGNLFVCPSDLLTPSSDSMATLPILLFQTYSSDNSLGSNLIIQSYDQLLRLPLHLVLRNSGRMQIINNLGNLVWSSSVSGRLNGEAPNPQWTSIRAPPRISYTVRMLGLDGTFNQNSSKQAQLSSGITFTNDPLFVPGIFLTSPDGQFLTTPQWSGGMTMCKNTTFSSFVWTSAVLVPSGSPPQALDDYYFELFQVGSTYYIGSWSAQIVSSLPVQFWGVELLIAPTIGNYAPFTLSIYVSGGYGFLLLENILNEAVPVYPYNAIKSFVCGNPLNQPAVFVDPFAVECAIGAIPNWNTTCA